MGCVPFFLLFPFSTTRLLKPGCWIFFDATRLAPLTEVVRIATGKDAADTAFATIFGQVEMPHMNPGARYSKSNLGSEPADAVRHRSCLSVEHVMQ